MALLAYTDAPPSTNGVALFDATWQDYPRWESANDWVAFRAPSLSHPDTPPYPGFAGRGTAETHPTGKLIRVELWSESRPSDQRLLQSFGSNRVTRSSPGVMSGGSSLDSIATM